MTVRITHVVGVKRLVKRSVRLAEDGSRIRSARWGVVLRHVMVSLIDSQEMMAKFSKQGQGRYDMIEQVSTELDDRLREHFHTGSGWALKWYRDMTPSEKLGESVKVLEWMLHLIGTGKLPQLNEQRELERVA